MMKTDELTPPAVVSVDDAPVPDDATHVRRPYGIPTIELLRITSTAGATGVGVDGAIFS